MGISNWVAQIMSRSIGKVRKPYVSTDSRSIAVCLRVYFDNSWGWSTFYFEVESESERLFIRRKTRDWTKNAPQVLTIPPKEDITVVMDLLDGWWEFEALPRSEGKLRVILEVGFSPEGDSLDVIEGKWMSSWIERAPIQ